MSKPIEQISSLVIGTVESVSPSEIKLILDTNAPQTTALNTGAPTKFPRINGYLLIPNETGSVVGLITSLGVERSNFPKRTGLKDFGLVDLPFPLRKISLTPVGTLVIDNTIEKSKKSFKLIRGVSVFPSVGDSVQIPTEEQIRSIIEASSVKDRRVKIGISPLSANADVTIDPDKIFGRHLAILGNTGSGKSCSLAGLIRWSLEEAKKVKNGIDKPNARFIILDPNGEYPSAFKEYKNVRIFKVNPKNKDIKPLLLPAWIWNSQEWSAFAHAAPNVQRPLLLQALRNLRAGNALEVPLIIQIRRDMKAYASQVDYFIQQAPLSNSNYGILMSGIRLIQNIEKDAIHHSTKAEKEIYDKLNALHIMCHNILDSLSYKKTNGSKGYNAFSVSQLNDIRKCISNILNEIGDAYIDSFISEDAPKHFAIDELPDHLEKIASDTPGSQTSQFISTLTMRIRMMLADGRLGPIVNPKKCSNNFAKWIESYIGADNAENGELSIIDLSLVPSDVIHIIIAVIARIVFESTQRYIKINDKELPTVLVLEEAHTFIKRGSYEESDIPTPYQMCRQTFERIAREGRKFGLGLVLSSQRPSELSPTVLAQCNTFLIHRIVNDRDQELVSKLVPDNLAGLLKELPSLPSRRAILLGWAITVPTLVEINELPKKYQPLSSDPKFWDVWIGKETRKINWNNVVDDWIGSSINNSTEKNEKD